MHFELPIPGAEAMYHPPSMPWSELTRLPNIRPFLGWKAYPLVTYQDWMNKFTSENLPVYDRQPCRPEFEYHGVINDGAHQGGFVSVDTHTLVMSPSGLRSGQYHHEKRDPQWTFFENVQEAPAPRQSFGFYRSVVDLGAPARGQAWDLFLAMREPMIKGDTRPGILILASKTYQFSIPPGYRPFDAKWTAACECSSLVKVGDYRIPESGCIEFRDSVPSGSNDQSDDSFQVLSGAGDGIYPVEIIRDADGNVVCVKVRFDGQGERTHGGQSALDNTFERGPFLGSSAADTAAPTSGLKTRRKSAGDVLQMTKGFLNEMRIAARDVF
ncbi:unnamed protein product [Mycena citricolor]|uniref:Uncharacterized protein n=1 Tax=Mycena citricolor TaxID=2018698 RepID=A0AAD2HEW9_9AGAR|nr:unnamed protein product [Mycena citricolor]